MLPEPFRFSFRPNDTQWYYWNNGVLGTYPSARYFEPPEGWRNTESRWKRSFESRGLIRTNGAAYQYLLDSASILRSVYYNGSIEAKVYYLIERYNYDVLAYENFIAGEVDLSTFNNGVPYNSGAIGVTATLIEGGIAGMLDAAGNTPYNIPIDPSDCDIINMDGLRLRGAYNYLAPATGTTAFSNANMFMPADIFTVREGDYPIAVSNSSTHTNAGAYTFGSFSGTAGQINAASDNYILEAGEALDLTVNVYYPNFYYSNTSPSADVQLTIEVLVVPGGSSSPFNFSQRFVVFQDSILAAGNNRTPPPIDVTTPVFTVGDGDRVYVVHYFYHTSTPIAGDFNYGEGAVHIDAEFRLAATDCNAYPYHVVADKLLELITGQSGLFSSAYFSNPNAIYHYCRPHHVKLTSGDALRRLTKNAAGTINTTPAIRISWDELKRDMKGRFGLGVAVRNGLVVVEHSSTFFNSSTIIADAGEVKTFTDTAARDYFTSSMKWGYPAQTYDNLNGRDEAITTAIYKTPQTRVIGEEDNLCPIRTDPYGIEAVRANLSGKKTIDAVSDNQTFAIETESATTGGKYNLYRPQNTYTQPAVTGFLFFDTMYNLTMLPVLNLRRSGGYIRSVYYGMDSQYLTFQTADKNAAISINLGGGNIITNADVLISSLDSAFFKPQLLHIEAILRQTFLDAMNNNPDGCIRYTEGGITYKGYPIDVMVKGADDNSYLMTLLCTEDTDLTARIV